MPPLVSGPRAVQEQDRAQLVTAVSEGDLRGQGCCFVGLLDAGASPVLAPGSSWVCGVPGGLSACLAPRPCAGAPRVHTPLTL